MRCAYANADRQLRRLARLACSRCRRFTRCAAEQPCNADEGADNGRGEDSRLRFTEQRPLERKISHEERHREANTRDASQSDDVTKGEIALQAPDAEPNTESRRDQDAKW